MYCHVGTAVDASNRMNFSTPQPCFESMHCPEGSETPQGSGECPLGYYCPFGRKISCPVGTYCDRVGTWDPRPCPPGRFNGQVAQPECQLCPEGYLCPGYGRVDPAICPNGFVCSEKGLETPNLHCPKGMYCNNGTMTSDPYRNDTTLRPYPCRPGTYCLGGVGFDRMRKGNFLYTQPCTPGFYCEAGSTSPVGSGLCPRGFYCPEGTAVPIPTPLGTQAELLGSVVPATCIPGFYAPTIETVSCYPCPPGTPCENDGQSSVVQCPPGSYRMLLEDQAGPVCIGCPQVSVLAMHCAVALSCVRVWWLFTVCAVVRVRVHCTAGSLVETVGAARLAAVRAVPTRNGVSHQRHAESVLYRGLPDTVCASEPAVWCATDVTE
jgi:hypothetical protein